MWFNVGRDIFNAMDNDWSTAYIQTCLLESCSNLEFPNDLWNWWVFLRAVKGMKCKLSRSKMLARTRVLTLQGLQFVTLFPYDYCSIIWKTGMGSDSYIGLLMWIFQITGLLKRIKRYQKGVLPSDKKYFHSSVIQGAAECSVPSSRESQRRLVRFSCLKIAMEMTTLSDWSPVHTTLLHAKVELNWSCKLDI